jgi:hypothetical protein
LTHFLDGTRSTSNTDRFETTTKIKRRPRGAAVLIAALVVIGVGARAAPIFNHDGRLFTQYPNDDSYLMLTIAHNIATGRGMTTAAGTTATNGTQPLVTFLWAGCYRLVGGDKTTGLAVILLVQLSIAAATGWLIVRLAEEVLPSHLHRAAGLAGAAWFASPAFTMHTQNSLETGTAALMLVASLSVYHRLLSRDRAVSNPRNDGVRAIQSMAVGVVLGVAFLVRNDACFLIAALCLMHWLHPQPGPRTTRLAESLITGATSVVISLPWLIYNVTRFGHLVPISGISESHAARFAQNLPRVFPAVAELVLTVVPIPASLEGRFDVLAVSLIIGLVGLGVFSLLWVRWGRPARVLVSIATLHAVCLVCFYGLTFGAAHAVGRFLAPLSGPAAILPAATAMVLVRALSSSRSGPPAVAAAVLVVLVVGLHGIAYRNGTRQGHYQVVEWVQRNVAEEVWVGAVQSGTCGYFHDRTINLDGKVNPDALEAILDDRLGSYVARDERIRYIVDWHGLTRWAERIGLTDDFEVVVDDPDRNLSVLRRTVVERDAG